MAPGQLLASGQCSSAFPNGEAQFFEDRAVSAFALEPGSIGPVDWPCSDVVCYPCRLLGLVERLLAAGTVRRLLCTIKFQGETDFKTQARLAAIPGSRLLHLSVNKHELTWARL